MAPTEKNNSMLALHWLVATLQQLVWPPFHALLSLLDRDMSVRRAISFFFFLCISIGATAFSTNKSADLTDMKMGRTRRDTIQSAAAIVGSLLLGPHVAQAFSVPSGDGMTKSALQTDSVIGPTIANVAYRPLSLDIPEYGVSVPVAMWYPVDIAADDDLKYNHRISVKKIGQLLAGWDFIPEFASKDFQLQPTIGAVVDGTKLDMPSSGPVVFLAHGYLGSRFDLSHLAEALAQEGTSMRCMHKIVAMSLLLLMIAILGFICLSAEFPESLAASYPRMDGLDRSEIMSSLQQSLKSEWGIEGTSFGIVGHSAGSGTAATTGDESWTRVCIAGLPRRRDGTTIPGSVLFLSSMNDGAVSLARFGGRASIPSEYTILDESSLGQLSKIPSKSFLLFDGPGAPNHISFLAGGTNDAMIDLLSPLLPVAQAMKIPVLDFDKYQTSRDSKQTAEVVIPLVISYLKQHMIKS